MSILCLKLPHETARLLSGIEVPGKREYLTFQHITLLFLGDETPIRVLTKALEATYAVTSKQRPFTVRTSTVTCFPKGDDGVPVICKIESDELHELQQSLRASFDKFGVVYSKRFKTFRPHVTLSYSEKPIEDHTIPTVEWGVHEIVLWGGDNGDTKLHVVFPLSLSVDPIQVAARFQASNTRS